MARLLNCCISGSLLALVGFSVGLSSLQARSPSSPSAGNQSTSANPAASAQAPDEATGKISDLVHAGKYAEAQKLCDGLLIAYPEDQRLIKAKALIEKLLASSAPPTAVGASTPPAAVGLVSPPLTGMDKVDYNALIELARQAQESTDSVEQYRLMGRFMGQSIAFLRKHPDQMLLWRLRAAIAIAANQPMDGYDAGRRLLAAGGADSNDPALQQLLAQLRNKGWLNPEGAQDAQEHNWLQSLKLTLAFAPWSTPVFGVFLKTTLTLTVSGLDGVKEPVNILLENASTKTCRLDGRPLGTIAIKPDDIAGGTFSASWKATLTDRHSYAVPCTINLFLLDKAGKPVTTVTLRNGN